MQLHSKATWLWLLAACLGWRGSLLWAAPEDMKSGHAATIRRVSVLGRGEDVEIEIDASQRVVPHAQALAGPDRLVIDFPDAVPGAQLRPLTVNRGEVKSVRVGLFSTNPPVTRIVLDLSGPRSYELFPAGNTLIVKLGAAKAIDDGANILAIASPGAIVTPLTAPRPAPLKAVQANFRKGLLSIRAQKATLAEVLYEVHRQTGAEIAVPAGAEQEQVTTDIGPMLPKDALAALLNGTHYNFILVSADDDPRSLGRVVLMPKTEGAMTGQAMGQQVFIPAPQQPADVVNEAAPLPDDPPVEPNHQRVVSPVPIPLPPEQVPPADEQPN